jgi:copper resistance protein C
MRDPVSRRLVLGAVAAALLPLSAPSALAHTHLASSSPAADAVVAAPERVTLTFSHALEPRFSGFEILDARGRRVNARSAIDPERNTTLVATPAAPLSAGIYRVTWHIVAHDGHRMRGEYRFTVR